MLPPVLYVLFDARGDLAFQSSDIRDVRAHLAALPQHLAHGLVLCECVCGRVTDELLRAARDEEKNAKKERIQ